MTLDADEIRHLGSRPEQINESWMSMVRLVLVWGGERAVAAQQVKCNMLFGLSAATDADVPLLLQSTGLMFTPNPVAIRPICGHSTALATL